MNTDKELKELLAQILDVETDYETDCGYKCCRWCGKYTDMQNKYCNNPKCYAVRARKILGIDK